MWKTFFAQFFIKITLQLFYNFDNQRKIDDMVATLTEMTNLWEKALRRIKQKINDDRSFDYFFANSYIFDKNGSNVIIVVPHEVAKAVIENQYIDLVIDALNELEDDEFSIKLITAKELEKHKEQKKKNQHISKTQKLILNLSFQTLLLVISIRTPIEQHFMLLKTATNFSIHYSFTQIPD